jgi:hypothetical protein
MHRCPRPPRHCRRHVHQLPSGVIDGSHGR